MKEIIFFMLSVDLFIVGIVLVLLAVDLVKGDKK